MRYEVILMFGRKITECDLIIKRIDDEMFNLRVKGCEDGNKLADEIAKEIEKVGISGSTESKDMVRDLRSELADIRTGFENVKLSKDNNKGMALLRANFAKEKSLCLKVKKYQKIAEKRFIRESGDEELINDYLITELFEDILNDVQENEDMD